jgi:hypothetical protein
LGYLFDLIVVFLAPGGSNYQGIIARPHFPLIFGPSVAHGGAYLMAWTWL